MKNDIFWSEIGSGINNNRAAHPHQEFSGVQKSQESALTIFTLQYEYLHIINRKSYENKENDHQSENALIFYQILSTNSRRKYMEISMDNLYVDIGA